MIGTICDERDTSRYICMHVHDRIVSFPRHPSARIRKKEEFFGEPFFEIDKKKKKKEDIASKMGKRSSTR